MKPGTPVLRSTRLLDQLRERIRYLHHSFNTEKAYLHWVRFFVRWHGRSGEMRHPRDMGAAEAVGSLSLTATGARFTAKTPLPLDLKEQFAIH
jgi:Phage integrase, N-terminal SAM-like domain